MQRTIDAAPDFREQDADRAPEAAVDAPDDNQAAGLVQEERKHEAPDPARRDHGALAERPAKAEPKAADVVAEVAVEEEVDVAPVTAQQLGHQAVEATGTKAPEDDVDATAVEDAALADEVAAEAVVADDETVGAQTQRADAGAQASARLVREEVFTAMPRPAGDTDTEVAAAEVAQAADATGEEGGRDEVDTGEAEPLPVRGQEEVAADDDIGARAGDQPPAGTGGGDGHDNNGGRGGKGPEDGGDPDDEEPGDDGAEPEITPVGRRPADAETGEVEAAAAGERAGEAEPARDEAAAGGDTAERDPLDMLRAHRNLVGGIERLLDDAIANEDEGATSTTALELVTAQEEMDRFIAEQIAAGTLTPDQVEAVRAEPLDIADADHTDGTHAADPTERTADTVAGDAAGDSVNIDLADHLGPEDGEPSEHDRVMTELRERVDHANRMAERLTAARDAELIAGIPVDEWLVDAAADAAQEASEYYNRHDTLLDDIELGTYDTTDGNVHFSINPAIPEVGDTTDEPTGDWATPPPHYRPDIWPDGEDTATGDTSTGAPENTYDSPPYWDDSNWPEGPEGADPHKGGWDINVQDLDSGSGPSDSGRQQQEEVKALTGTVMEHIWNKLSLLHEKIVTSTESRTVERLRIVDGVMKVDLYKVSQIENTPLPSRYYLRTGHTGIRNGIFGGFREQKPVALKSVYGNNVSAAKIMARQERRQQQLHHARGSSGLLALATAVRTAYGAKADEHRARVIYRHEKSNFEFKHMQQRQHLRSQMQQTQQLRGALREERRQEIRDELRRLRYEERRFKQHHKTVKSQSVHHRAARGTLRASSKALKGTAKGSAWAAKKGAKGTAKVARRTADIAATRWAARQAGPGGNTRPPRNPGGRRSGRGPRRTPNQPPKAPNGSVNQQNAEDE